MENASSLLPLRYFGHAIVATFCVVLLPALVVTGLQLAGHVESSLVAMAIGALLSVAFASLGSRLWARRPHDVVFSDLMLWGFLRRLRTERRLAETKGLLGLDSDGLTLAPHVVGEQAIKALESLSAALESRDPYTAGHTQRVARHSHMIAKAMGLSDEQVAKVRTAAAVHDVGKISTPREVMNKPGKLTPAEYEEMKRHAIVGAAMAARIDDPEITAMVRHHHEQLDGGGYPDGLAGSDIPLGARIIAVADTFDAITSARPDRTAQQHRRAMRILRAQAGTQLDPRAVEAFLGYYSGRRSVAGWSMIAAAPQKLGALVGGLLNTTGAASISQGVAAIGAAAAIASGAGGVAHKHHLRDTHRAGHSAPALVHAAYTPATGGSVVPAEETIVPDDLSPETGEPGGHDKPKPSPRDKGSARHEPAAETAPQLTGAGPKDVGKGKDGGGQPGSDSGGKKNPDNGKKDPEPVVTEPTAPTNGNGAGNGKGQTKPKPNPKPAPEPAPTPDPAPVNGGGKGPKPAK
jgi:putative nucleotidyltransferase with HDIG domain